MGKIAQYRERLDETLASDNLADDKKLKTLVKDQILLSSDYNVADHIDKITGKRTQEVSNFLEMLRSASENYDSSSHHIHHASWKLKQDNEDFRVMYREGPVGSPFHSLLVEGYIDAPLDVCLCVSWETALYPRWFPETSIPTFKIAAAKSLQKVRIGEEIALVRVKLSWPLSSREAILHYFEFQYLESDLVVVLINTIPDMDNIQMETHGFTNELIPEADNTVRMELVGGFALQKVTDNRSYFRTIGNLDIKLDFVPPSLINFISRQLIGTGFRFFKKTVASISNGDEAFTKALNDPLYSRIRQAVYSNNESERNLGTHIIQDRVGVNKGEQKTDSQDAARKEDVKDLSDDHVRKKFDGCKPSSNEIEEEEIKEGNGHVSRYLLSEVEEEEIKGSENGKVNNSKDAKESSASTGQPQLVNFNKSVPISPQVEKALGTLDKMIYVVKERRLKAQNCPQSAHKIDGNESISSTTNRYVKVVDKQGTLEKSVSDTPHESRVGVSNDGLRPEKSDLQTQVAESYAISPDQNPSIANWSRSVLSARNSPVMSTSPINLEVNDINEENNKKTEQPKKWRLCCFHLVSGRLVS